MISISTTIVENAIKKFESKIEAYSQEALTALEDLQVEISLGRNSVHKKFIDNLLNELKGKNIVSLTKSEIDVLSRTLGPVPLTKKAKKSKVKTLKDRILDALNYEARRADFYPDFFNEIGIKACIYCNSQYTLTVSRNTFTKTGKNRFDSVVTAKFQVDHSIAKKDFPYLSISLYNLYPTCATCNNIKSEKKVDFELYTDSPTPSKYLFSLTDASKSIYITTLKSDDLEIKFHDPLKGNEKNEVRGSFEDTFHITGIYNTQKDVAEELLCKSLIYNKEFRQTLKEQFDKAIPGAKNFNRILVGNYCEPEEIHKRPLSKFMQDIARDVGLL